MVITHRKQEFIKKIVELYSISGLPIHYTNLADEIGVSKWSSYEMLTELEKLGYITREYVNTPNKSGRSKTIFSPTSKALSLFDTIQNDSLPLTNKQWTQKKKLLKAELSELKELPLSSSIGRVTEMIQNENNQLLKAAYLFFFYFIIAHKSESRISDEVIDVVKLVKSPSARYMIITGAIVENIARNNLVISPGGMPVMIQRAVETIPDVLAEDLKRLMDFILEIV
ncbi:MAG: hypothetical protein PF637_00095 [Spirochaetes bacterium]|jgi:predicted transcriptional regulator|nr:hypothetical protein [Spirochaetota bacterium]